MPSVNVSDSLTATESVTAWHFSVNLGGGDLGPLTAAVFTTAMQMGLMRGLVAVGAGQPMMLGGGSTPLDAQGYPTTPGLDGTPKNSLDGSSVAPCLTLYRTGQYGPIMLPVAAGSRTFSIDVKYGPDDGAGTRPQIVIRGPEIGVPETIIAVSGSANSWHTYQGTFKAHAAGAIQVFFQLRNPRLPGIDGLISKKVYASFDNIQIN